MNGRIRPPVRLSRRFLPAVAATVHEASAGTDSTPALSGGQCLLIATWFGVLAGLLELLQLAVRNQLSGSVWLGVLRVNRHFGWMIPAANAAIFLAVGVVLCAVVAAVPKVGRWLAVRVPGFLAALALLSSVRGLYPVAVFSLAAAIGHTLGRVADARGPAVIGLFRKSLWILAVLQIGLAGVCTAPLLSRDQPGASAGAAAGAATSGERRFNVLLLVLDTVRAESLSLHGYDRPTTPNLARLAQRGVRFDQARAPAPWTFPSHASLFTGRWPHELNVGENRPLDGTYPTLAEQLAARGYRTGGFVANTFFCNAWYGLGRGFHRYEDFYDDDVAISWVETVHSAALGRRLLGVLGMSQVDHRVRKDAARINRDFLRWLSETDGRPYFAFLNYFDAHSPYLLPDGARRRLGTPEPDARELAALRDWEQRPKQNVEPHETRLVRDAYDECIAYLDEQLGILFDELKRRGELEDTLVIITSDHGEELGEHGLFGHGKSLYGQETRVPLIVIPPGERAASAVVSEPVSLRDIPATVMDVLGAGEPSPFPGTSLAVHWGSRPSDPAERASSPAFSEVALRMGVSRNPNRPPAWRGPMQSVAAGRRSYIRNADGTEELYDLTAGPIEEHNLAAEPGEGEILESLRRIVRSLSPPEP